MTQSANSMQASTDTLDQRAFEIATRPVGLRGKLGRATQILQHYRLSQICRRVVNVARRKLQPGKVVGVWEPKGNTTFHFNSGVLSLAAIAIDHAKSHPSHRQCDLESGKYVLLNHEVTASGGLPEEALEQQTHLWKFQFHYHEFLLNQAARGRWSQVGAFLSAWLERYSPGATKQSDDSWHPYCISRRIVSWVWLLCQSSREDAGLGEELVSQLERSLVHQAEHLSRNLEWDLGGNHLLENATALAIVSSIVELSDSLRWNKTAFRILQSELGEQVLSHGEHFELSPMYHCQILNNLLRIVICHGDQSEFERLLGPSIDQMMEFLDHILLPDGEVPLFADSNFHEAPSVSQIKDVAGLRGCKLVGPVLKTTTVGNYSILSDGDTHAICDFGQIAASHLPAHGHCDALNVVVSVEGKRWIVDSGNFNYSNDSMRHYCRSSMGHNVLTIDDANQANVWSMFRMGNRPTVFDHRSGNESEWNWASASHDGYTNVGVPRVTRLVALGERALACLDFPTTASTIHAESCVGYLHFHPDVEIGSIEAVGETRYEVAAGLMDIRRKLTFIADLVSLEQGWYCDEFGKRAPGPVLRYVSKVPCSGTGWILGPCENQVEIEFRKSTVGITICRKSKFQWTLDQ